MTMGVFHDDVILVTGPKILVQCNFPLHHNHVTHFGDFMSGHGQGKDSLESSFCLHPEITSPITINNTLSLKFIVSTLFLVY